MNLLNIERNLQNKIIIATLVSLLIGSSVAILPLTIIASIVILIAGVVGIGLAYRWPEFFLILAVWTYFLKFTFIYSIGGLGITPFMIFETLALAGYGLRILTGRQRLILPIGLGFLIFFISFTTLSLLIVNDLEVALGAYFRAILDWMLMLLLIQMIVDRHNLKRLLTALFIQAVVLISWGIADAVQSMLSGLPLTSYSSFFWNQFRKNDFAVYLMFISLLSLVILLRGDNRREKFLAVFLLILIPAAWFITRSRSGVLALTMGILIFLVLERNGKLLKLLFSFSIIAVISFAIFPSEERDLALDGLRAIVNPENVVAERNLETISLRFELMEAGWQVFADQPLLGVGFNQWQFYSPISNYRRDPRTSELILKPLEIHNQHLQIATNNGLFALMGYLGFVTIILISGMRARPKARGMIRSLLHALIAILLVEQITLMVMTGFLWEWPIFGIFIGLINVAKIEKRQSGESL